MTREYPTVIDWCPFPSVRDRLILFHAANSSIDEIICDMASSYAVETDLSTLVSMPGPVQGYVRAWDIIQAMKENDDDGVGVYENRAPEIHTDTMHSNSPCPATLRLNYLNEREQPSTSACSLPAPTTDTLFKDKSYARLAFEALGMDNGLAIFKLDPNFFAKYPELYEPGANVVARGVPLVRTDQKRIPPPHPMLHSTALVYQRAANWAVDAICSLTD